jgi:hypothetical protein
MTIVLAYSIAWLIFIFGIKSELVLVSLVITLSFPVGILVVITSDYLFGSFYVRDKQTE